MILDVWLNESPDFDQAGFIQLDASESVENVYNLNF